LGVEKCPSAVVDPRELGLTAHNDRLTAKADADRAARLAGRKSSFQRLLDRLCPHRQQQASDPESDYGTTASGRKAPTPVGPKMACAERAVLVAEYLAGHHATTREDLAAALNCSTEVARYMTSGSGTGPVWVREHLAELGYAFEEERGAITVTALTSRKRAPRKAKAA
jgi:hypothetical protein